MLAPGYDSEIEFSYVTSDQVPSSAQYRADVRETTFGPVLASLTTLNGGVQQVSCTLQSSGNYAGRWLTVIRVKFSGSMSAEWAGKSLGTDISRTDLAPPMYLGIRIGVEWPHIYTQAVP
jgi:hypothetical protein